MRGGVGMRRGQELGEGGVGGLGSGGDGGYRVRGGPTEGGRALPY